MMEKWRRQPDQRWSCTHEGQPSFYVLVRRRRWMKSITWRIGRAVEKVLKSQLPFEKQKRNIKLAELEIECFHTLLPF